ncbi:MAG: hypothetical protein NXI31_01865 [bacterium]|nr:hypothetical protein [bacterium]
MSLNELEGLGVLPHWPEVRINGNLVQGGAELEWAWCTGGGQPATASVSSFHSDPEGSSNATFAGPWTGLTYLTAHMLKCLTDRSQGHR